MSTETLPSSPEKKQSSQVFFATLRERFRINPGSDKETYHVILEADIPYEVGDCIGVYPENDPHYVDKILTTLNYSEDHLVEDREGNPHPIGIFLRKKANLNRISRKILNDKSSLLEALSHGIPEPSSFCPHLSPMLPRYYSIASSPIHSPKEIHLTVAVNENPADAPFPFGTCSHYLCHRAPLNEPSIEIFHQPAPHFSLPEEALSKPLIMIGPGTGIAPFRGFLQERAASGNSSPNWLFFGERSKKTDFYYQDEWESLQSKGILELTTAFSRDQEEKIYVQDRLYEQKEKLWDWLEEGAYLYICGDKKNMAKAVEATLYKIAEEVGGLTPQEAKAYFKDLRQSRRFQKDVY